MKAGDIVRFRPSIGYVDDWARSKMGPAPDEVGIIVPDANREWRNTFKFKVGWVRVIFPPDTREWDVFGEDLEVIGHADART